MFSTQSTAKISEKVWSVVTKHYVMQIVAVLLGTFIYCD